MAKRFMVRARKDNIPKLSGHVIDKIKKAKIKKSVNYDVPHYAQTEEFTGSAACALMALKYINNKIRIGKEQEYDIWQEAVNGSVWTGSKYGIAYALAKRGARVGIISNVKDEGSERKLAVYEGINLDTLIASFNEIRNKAKAANIEEYNSDVSLKLIKKALSAKHLPILLVDAKGINPTLDSSPHWVVVSGYDKDTFFVNDPYSDSKITMDADAFKNTIGFDGDNHMIVVDMKYYKPPK
ncbi:MAG: peptidase C39 family protein [Candidatus Micrarchaeaceae archaeon]